MPALARGQIPLPNGLLLRWRGPQVHSLGIRDSLRGSHWRLNFNCGSLGLGFILHRLVDDALLLFYDFNKGLLFLEKAPDQLQILVELGVHVV